MSERLKSLPAVDRVMAIPEIARLGEHYSRELVTRWARSVVNELRSEVLAGRTHELGDDGKVTDAEVASRMRTRAELAASRSLRRVVNATGIVIHTNLGRSPLSKDLMGAMESILGGYSNLEFDLESGERGSRHDHLAGLIRDVTGAESGFAVNNNAAAVLVCLNTLARGREVVVSRGELVEIGGSFRIPDIITRGGARLVEAGTTNKTRIDDYRRALSPDTALLLKVHTSNYQIQGFTEEASLSELVELGREQGAPVMMDLGSGLLADLSGHGITDEKPVGHYVKTGADLVTFSGDKLLGGPQAGFVTGRSHVVEEVKKNPLVRALRVGKLTIAALEAMLRLHLSPGSLIEAVPTLSLLTRSVEDIEAAADELAEKARTAWPDAKVSVERDENFAGGGALPARPLPTRVVTIEAPGVTADMLAVALRRAPVPVVGRMRSGRFCLDCRTVMAEDVNSVSGALAFAREKIG